MYHFFPYLFIWSWIEERLLLRWWNASTSVISVFAIRERCTHNHMSVKWGLILLHMGSRCLWHKDNSFSHSVLSMCTKALWFGGYRNSRQLSELMGDSLVSISFFIIVFMDVLQLERVWGGKKFRGFWNCYYMMRDGAWVYFCLYYFDTVPPHLSCLLLVLLVKSKTVLPSFFE